MVTTVLILAFAVLITWFVHITVTCELGLTKIHPRRTTFVVKCVHIESSAPFVHLEDKQTAPRQSLLPRFPQFHFWYSNKYLQWMTADLTGTESEWFPMQRLFQLLACPISSVLTFPSYQYRQQNAVIQTSEAAAIVLLLKPPPSTRFEWELLTSSNKKLHYKAKACCAAAELLPGKLCEHRVSPGNSCYVGGCTGAGRGHFTRTSLICLHLLRVTELAACESQSKGKRFQ